MNLECVAVYHRCEPMRNVQSVLFLLHVHKTEIM